MTDLETSPFAQTLAKPGALMAVPVGLASPLWGLFAGAAIGGSAWWWMTRWARTENLEAMFAAAADAAPVGTVEAIVEAAVETAPPPEASVEAPEPPVVAEPAVEPPALDAAVDGEAAPLAPVVAPLVAPVVSEVAPKPRVRKAEPPKPE